MSFSYLYILQRQWIQDVNSISNSVKCMVLMKLCAFNHQSELITSLFSLFFQQEETKWISTRWLSETFLPPAAITNLTSCVRLKISTPYKQHPTCSRLMSDA